MNRRNCKEAVTKYMEKSARAAGADRRVLRGCQKTVHECIDERVRFLKERWLNKWKIILTHYILLTIFSKLLRLRFLTHYTSQSVKLN